MKALVLLFLVVIFFQNCSNDVGFDNRSIASEGTIAPNEAEEFTEPEIEEPVVDLDEITDLCDKGAKLSETIHLEFPKPNRTCEWEVDGNMSPLNQYFRARIEQKRNLDIAAGAIICDAKFDFAKQDFLYDDHFMLLFNNSVIAASYNFSENLVTNDHGFLQYEWGRISGMFWDTSKEQIYCPQIPGASSNCQFPGHDQQGSIQLAYDPIYIQGIMTTGVPENHSFSVISMGDNDAFDCEHSDLQFSVTVEYVLPK